MYHKIKFKVVTTSFLKKVINQLPNYRLACPPMFTVLDQSPRGRSVNSTETCVSPGAPRGPVIIAIGDPYC